MQTSTIINYKQGPFDDNEKAAFSEAGIVVGNFTAPTSREPEIANP
jgi:hypothetical protein